jgi:hypothetical protein
MRDVPPANLRVAERVAAILGESKLPVVVIGAVALAAHRYPRFTEDIDLAVLASQSEMQSLTESLRAEGFDVEFHKPDAEDPLAGVIDVSGPFGLVQIINFEDRFPAIIHDALAAADVRIRPDSTLRIVPIPQLVALKLYAGGWKSHADIVELLRRNPDVDLDAIGETCRKYRLPGFGRVIEDLSG